jgi:hypothetical protein
LINLKISNLYKNHRKEWYGLVDSEKTLVDSEISVFLALFDRCFTIFQQLAGLFPRTWSRRRAARHVERLYTNGRQDLTATDRVVLPFRQRSPGLALTAGRPACGYENNTFQVSNHNDLLYLVYFASLSFAHSYPPSKKQDSGGKIPAFP